ncbi:MAG TPA: fibronectin type III domain-containing protein [Bryobacteraceae bacterium]|nr:fibronectin type III domain-containing protein [Bryobacteraceae bacterium]
MRKFIPALAALAAAGCGYVGEPLPPLANIPARVVDLTAVQRGGQIQAQFTLPMLTTEGVTIRSPLELDLRVGESEAPFHEEEWAAHARKVPGRSASAGIAKLQFPSAEWTGKQVLIAVRIIGSNGKASAWSNFVAVPVVAAPATPTNVKVEAVPTGVTVTWNAPGTRFRVFRRTGTAEAETVATVEQPSWTDTSTQYGQKYTYQVQSITSLGQNREALSELSTPAAITPEDRFPPAVPTGLRAAASPNSVELSWDTNTESDLAGYRLYRSTAGGRAERIAEVTIPAYSDHMVEPGKTYRYEVSAFDRSGHESPHSAPVEIALQ